MGDDDLARELVRLLQQVADTPEGDGTKQIAERLDAHRTTRTATGRAGACGGTEVGP